MSNVKACPYCGDTHLVRYSSLQKQQCSNCGAMVPWKLKDGQKPIVSSNRDVRKQEPTNE